MTTTRDAGLRLLMAHRSLLYAYIHACVRNHHDAEDIWQDVSVAVLQSIETLRHESEFLAWAREIARRRVLGFRRKSSHQRALDPALVQALSDAAERLNEHTSTEAHLDAFRTCIEQLPEESRRVLAQRYSDQADLTGIAREMGRSLQGVYALLKRLRISLRECVQRRISEIVQ